MFTALRCTVLRALATVYITFSDVQNPVAYLHTGGMLNQCIKISVYLVYLVYLLTAAIKLITPTPAETLTLCCV